MADTFLKSEEASCRIWEKEAVIYRQAESPDLWHFIKISSSSLITFYRGQILASPGESSFFCQDRGSVLLYAEVLDPALQYWPNLRQCILKKVTLAYSATNGCSFEAILFRGDGHFWPTSAITYIIQHIRIDSPRYRKANIQVPTPPGHTHTWAVLGVYSIRVLSGKLVVAKGIFWNDEIETPYIILEISFPKAVIIRMNNPHSITPIYILCLRPLRDAKEN